MAGTVCAGAAVLGGKIVLGQLTSVEKCQQSLPLFRSLPAWSQSPSPEARRDRSDGYGGTTRLGLSPGPGSGCFGVAALRQMHVRCADFDRLRSC